MHRGGVSPGDFSLYSFLQKKYIHNHLSKSHNLHGISCVYLCSSCRKEVIDNVKDHECFNKDNHYFQVDISEVHLAFACKRAHSRLCSNEN